MYGLPRMRTIAESARLLKEDDPGTAITKNAIRSMALKGEIPCVRVGNKRLINYDKLLETLGNPPSNPTDGQTGHGILRRVG